MKAFLIATGRPRADVDLRGLSHHGQIFIFQIHFQRLPWDEELLVAEHSQLYFGSHVVLAAEKIQLSLQNAAAHVVGHTRENILQKRSGFLDFILIDFHHRQLEVGLGLKRFVGPPHKSLEDFIGTIKLASHSIDLGHPQFCRALPERAFEFLRGRNPFIERTCLRVFAPSQRDVGIGYEESGLRFGIQSPRIGIHPRQHELRQVASAVEVARLRILSDEPRHIARVEFLVHLHSDRWMRAIAIPCALQVACCVGDLGVVNWPARVAARHWICATKSQNRLGS